MLTFQFMNNQKEDGDDKIIESILKTSHVDPLEVFHFYF